MVSTKRGLSASSPSACRTFYRGAHTLAEFDKRIFRPEALLQNIPAYDFARVFKQEKEDLKGLIL